MRQNFNRRKYLLIVSLSLFVILQTEAQTIRKQSVASAGNSMSANGILIQQTIGQAYATTAYYNNGISYQPGFQQLYNMRTEFVHSTIKLNMKVYPNPAAHSVTIESPEIIHKASIQVRNMKGEIIINEQVDELRKHTIRCENWPNGFYFITLSNEHKNNYTSKLIITK
jgi:hypothetical protein